MVEVSGPLATAERRSPWRALRPVLVLGGFVAVWWALMSGVAQADSAPQHGLVDQLRSRVAPQHADEQRPVRDAVRRVHDEAMQKTPLAAVRTKAARTVETVHDTLSQTIETTRATVGHTDDEPVFTSVEDTVTGQVGKAESSTAHGNSPKLRHGAKVLPTAPAGPTTAASVHEPSSSAAADRPALSPLSTLSTHRDAPLDGLRANSLPDPCTSPGGSGSSSFTPVGITVSSLLVVPTVQRDFRTWRLARLPGGPTYQPGSSPD